MPKINVDITLATHDEVAAVLADFGVTGLQTFRKVQPYCESIAQPKREYTKKDNVSNTQPVALLRVVCTILLMLCYT